MTNASLPNLLTIFRLEKNCKEQKDKNNGLLEFTKKKKILFTLKKKSTAQSYWHSEAEKLHYTNPRCLVDKFMCKDVFFLDDRKLSGNRIYI